MWSPVTDCLLMFELTFTVKYVQSHDLLGSHIHLKCAWLFEWHVLSVKYKDVTLCSGNICDIYITLRLNGALIHLKWPPPYSIPPKSLRRLPFSFSATVSANFGACPLFLFSGGCIHSTKPEFWDYQEAGVSESTGLGSLHVPVCKGQPHWKGPTVAPNTPVGLK